MSPRAINAIRGRRNRATGERAEAIVAAHLRSLGLLCVERIETGWTPIRRGSVIVGAKPNAKVSGDFKAVMPGGQAVIAEVKCRDSRLCWSDLDTHQRRGLQEHHDAGAIALLVWYSPGKGIAVMRWPVEGLTGGGCLAWKTAEKMRWRPSISQEKTCGALGATPTGKNPSQGSMAPGSAAGTAAIGTSGCRVGTETGSESEGD